MKLKDECIQMYEGRKVNCIVTKVEENTFNATILGIGIEMVDIPKEKFNPKYCLKDIGYEHSVKGLMHHYDTTKGLYATDFEPKRLSNEIVNRINKEFNLELKTIDSAQMDEFIQNYLKTIMFRL